MKKKGVKLTPAESAHITRLLRTLPQLRRDGIEDALFALARLTFAVDVGLAAMSGADFFQEVSLILGRLGLAPKVAETRVFEADVARLLGRPQEDAR